MSANTFSEQSNGRSGVVKRIFQSLLHVILLALILAALIFIPAGSDHLDWGMAWILLGVYSTGLFVTFLLLNLCDPDLARERAKIQEGTKGWDKKLVNLFNSLIYLVMPPLAGVDKRLGWSPPVSLAVQWMALIVFVLGMGLFDWAMLSNRFFSGTVRIQEDRGHTVVADGPYRVVRHPGYVGMIVMFVLPPLVLGSLWALIPAGLAALATVIRTALEDKTLQVELPGYAEYAQRTRYRLLPRVW